MASISKTKHGFVVRWRDATASPHGRTFDTEAAAKQFKATLPSRGRGRPANPALVAPLPASVASSPEVTPIRPEKPKRTARMDGPRRWYEVSCDIAEEILQALKDGDEVKLSQAARAGRAISALVTSNRRFLDDEEVRLVHERLRGKMKEMHGYRKDHI